MHARDGILAVHATEQLRHRARVDDVPDDPKQRGFLVRLLSVGGLQQLAYAEAVLLRANDFQHRRLGHPGGGERLQQHVRRVIATAAECPGNAGDDSRAALDEPLHELGEGLLADETAEHLDECDGRVLVSIR